jgi:hypothetical protein
MWDKNKTLKKSPSNKTNARIYSEELRNNISHSGADKISVNIIGNV